MFFVKSSGNAARLLMMVNAHRSTCYLFCGSDHSGSLTARGIRPPPPLPPSSKCQPVYGNSYRNIKPVLCTQEGGAPLIHGLKTLYAQLILILQLYLVLVSFGRATHPGSLTRKNQRCAPPPFFIKLPLCEICDLCKEIIHENSKNNNKKRKSAKNPSLGKYPRTNKIALVKDIESIRFLLLKLRHSVRTFGKWISSLNNEHKLNMYFCTMILDQYRPCIDIIFKKIYTIPVVQKLKKCVYFLFFFIDYLAYLVLFNIYVLRL